MRLREGACFGRAGAGRRARTSARAWLGGGTPAAGRREFGERQDQDKLGTFMTAIMSRREKGRAREERIKRAPRQNRGLYDRYNVKKGGKRGKRIKIGPRQNRGLYDRYNVKEGELRGKRIKSGPRQNRGLYDRYNVKEGELREKRKKRGPRQNRGLYDRYNVKEEERKKGGEP